MAAKTLAILLCCSVLILWASPGHAKRKRIGESLCNEDGFSCVTIIKGDTWKSLWPDETERQAIQRLNRMNVRLRKGMILAVPIKWEKKIVKKMTPFPKKVETPNEKVIMVDLNQLAWGAYDDNGKLVRWGPASGGKNWCPDVKRGCRTPQREFSMRWKQGRRCKSKKFPIPKGGAPMPYCMFFYGGYAMHGSPTVPGYNASHGCVRLFAEDARWLNEEFIELPDKKAGLTGTKVIVMPYSNKRRK